MILSTLATAVIVINELMASNAGMTMSPATNFDSWIELYNPTEERIDLGGMYLSDDPANLTLWKMPKDMGSIPAKGYKVVWLGSNDIKHNQAPFKLDCEGGTIYLSDQSGQLIESQTYPEAMSRTSYARKTDGGGEWGFTDDATPGASNETAVFSDKRLAPPTVSQNSQLFTNTLSLDVAIPDDAVLVYTTDGSLPKWNRQSGNTQEWIDHIVNGDCESEDVTCLVGKDGDAGGDLQTHIVDGAGYNGSRGIKIHSVSQPTYDWDTQFFVYTPDHTWSAGERYRFHMKVRADRPAHISVQSHTTPSNYIHWSMLAGGYDITTEWKEIEYEGTVTNEQAGMNGLQTIAFNLNELRGVENNYYFDDISWESHVGSNQSTSKISKDGHFSIRETTNFVFRFFRDGYLPSIPVTRSYIKTSNKYTIPVVSIVGDKRYFTDPMWGIDTQGTNGRTGNGQSTKCNFNMDWERPVNFSFITPDGVMAYNQDVEISVSGGWTRSAYPRSFKLKAGKEFDGQNRLDYMFFPQKPYLRNKMLLLRNGGNDVWENNGSRFLDPALQTIIQRSGINLDVQSYVPIIEYVNGEFRGVLNMREPNNKRFVESNFGYDDEHIDMFEMSADSNVVFMVGNSLVLERIYELGTHATEPDTYAELSEILDLDEFINYMAVELFLGSTDWPHNNIKGFRSQDNGRYRFVTFDLDFAFKNSNPFTAFANDQWHTFNYIYDTQEERYEEIKLVTFFLNMLKNDQFRKKFIDAYCIIGGSVFEKERATAIVKELADFVRPMMQLDGRRSPDSSADLICSKMNTLNESMTACMQQFKPMQLTGIQRQKVSISSDTPGAQIFINGQSIPYSDFDGYLFAPITLEAKAPAGYHFTGWKRSANISNELIGLSSTWKYYDKGAQSGVRWRTSSFDDSTWSTGESPLGYKMDGVVTTVGYGSDANQKNPTTYFRKTVSLANSPSDNDLFQLNYKVDDGFVIYVNGMEAARVNMPSGTVNFNTFSSTYASDTPLTGVLQLNANLFHSGDNLIAVEVHNNNATSSDLFWAAQLLTTVDANDDNILSADASFDPPQENGLALTACFTPFTEDEKAMEGITPVRINEVSASNGIYVNEYWKRNDWLELYNTTDQPIDVEGMYLTDNPEKPQKYQISKESTEANTVIPAYGYLIVWCDKLETQTYLHASFKLSDEGEVMLTSSDGTWSDRFVYSSHKADESVGRYPDGSNNVYAMNLPTIAKGNIITSYMTEVPQPATSGIEMASLLPTNPRLTARYVMGKVIVRGESMGSLKLTVCNLAGQVIGQQTKTGNNYSEFAVDDLQPGCYIARIADEKGHYATCKFVKKQ